MSARQIQKRHVHKRPISKWETLSDSDPRCTYCGRFSWKVLCDQCQYRLREGR